jgi:hypothetical protein
MKKEMLMNTVKRIQFLSNVYKSTDDKNLKKSFCEEAGKAMENCFAYCFPGVEFCDDAFVIDDLDDIDGEDYAVYEIRAAYKELFNEEMDVN